VRVIFPEEREGDELCISGRYKMAEVKYESVLSILKKVEERNVNYYEILMK
jgi:hypothetical protein